MTCNPLPAQCLKLRALLQETEKECEILRDKVHEQITCCKQFLTFSQVSSLESCEQELSVEVSKANTPE